MGLWVVPGCPLEGGRGWRIWLSREGAAEFTPGPIEVTNQARQPQEFTTGWTLLAPLRGLDRRIGVATITLASPRPGEPYRLRFSEPAPELRLRTLPAGLKEPVCFLFNSCFYRPTDPDGRYSAGLEALPSDWKPAFKLLIGDQLYCDWPPDTDTLNVIAGRAHEVYGHRYATYWGDEAYRRALQSAPNYFLSEDHEFWNDFPETSLRIMRSWAPYRETFRRAAEDYYRAFQACNNEQEKRWWSFTVGPVSFFGADTRSERETCESADSAIMSKAQWGELEAWGAGLRGPGILSLGQPLLKPPGEKGGLTISNFTRQYDRLWKVLERAARGQGADGKPHDILILGGDIHTSRYCEATCDGLTIREFISSPVSKICPDRTTPEEPPDRIEVGEGTGRRTWTVQPIGDPTLDSTVGLVRMAEGLGGKVVMELALWRLRPYPRDWIGRMRRCLGLGAPQGEFQFIFSHTVELR